MPKTIPKYSQSDLDQIRDLCSEYPDDIAAIVRVTCKNGAKFDYAYTDPFSAQQLAENFADAPISSIVEVFNLWCFRNLHHKFRVYARDEYHDTKCENKTEGST